MSKCNSTLSLKKIRALRKLYNAPILTARANNYDISLQLDNGKSVLLNRKTNQLSLDTLEWSVDLFKQNMNQEDLTSWEIEKQNYNYNILNNLS